MKSKNAELYLAMHIDPTGFVHSGDARQAIEIAEEEVIGRAYEELTRWHDREHELPPPGKDVLVQRLNGLYGVDSYNPVDNRFVSEYAGYMQVIRWREIHE